MLTFTEEKLNFQKLKNVIVDNEEKEGNTPGCSSKIRVKINDLPLLDRNNGEINGPIEQYEVSFTVNDNTLYGVKGLLVETPTNAGIEPVESVESGEKHLVRVESEFTFEE